MLGILEMRRHYTNYFKGFSHIKYFRDRLVVLTTYEEINKVLEEIIVKYEGVTPERVLAAAYSAEWCIGCIIDSSISCNKNIFIAEATGSSDKHLSRFAAAISNVHRLRRNCAEESVIIDRHLRKFAEAISNVHRWQRNNAEAIDNVDRPLHTSAEAIVNVAMGQRKFSEAIVHVDRPLRKSAEAAVNVRRYVRSFAEAPCIIVNK